MARLQQCGESANITNDPGVRALHLEFAERYAVEIRKLDTAIAAPEKSVEQPWPANSQRPGSFAQNTPAAARNVSTRRAPSTLAVV